MPSRVFVDANIILDLFDVLRPSHHASKKAFTYLVQHSDIYTSCDIITTLYYIGVKINKAQILHNLIQINKTLNIIDFTNDEVDIACQLMLNDQRYNDLEDTLQYVLAQKIACELILTNDATFVSHDITVMNSTNFCTAHTL